MTGSLSLALLLGIGHHFYYDYLNGKIVENKSQQEWYLRGGTGIAFLTRALLSAAVGFAYTQILWQTLRSKSVTIQGINSLFGILHDAWDFTTWELWTAAPALAVVAMIACQTVKNSTCCGDTAGFVGFVPAFNVQDKTLEQHALLGLKSALNDSLVSKASTFDRTDTTKYAKLYVVVPDKPISEHYIMANKTIECQLYNTSFAINFTFNNGKQDISYKTKRLNGVSYVDAGLSSKGSKDTSRFHASVAYLSLMDALGRLLLGSLQISHYGVMSPIQTQIMSSVLMDSKELQIVQEMNAQQYSTGDLPKAESVIGNISIADALEQLFTNVTISLFSNSKFLQNETTASRGPITYLSTQIAFSYAPRNLFIAYGVGIIASAFIVATGLLCINSASASYGNSFSTILRTTRNPDLDTIVPVAETSGAEPLSKDLGDVRLVLRRQGHEMEGVNNDMATRFVVDSMPDKMEGTQRETPNDSSIPRNREPSHAGWI
ncbi:hypothetical protein IL306_010902 [Fusarium sp. DS 682]|nr:hypothetical protein IL306_010902 [Fusarium sp. DS 682]